MSTDSLENFSIKYLIICYRIYIVDITLCPSTKHQSAAKFYGNAFRNQDDPTAYGSTLKNEYDPTVYGRTPKNQEPTVIRGTPKIRIQQLI